MSIEKLVEISNFYGKNEDFVLAGGGNTSYKDGEFLYIKGSGTTLATITAEGFVKMNRRKLASMWEKDYSADVAEREAQVLVDLMDAREDKDKRPSVETSLHDLFEQKYVVHTHPALINGLTCGANGEKIAEELFGSDVIWIPPTMPGYVLAAEVKKKIDALKAKGVTANTVFLANHGVFVSGNDESEIAALMDDIFNKLKSVVKHEPDFTPIQKDAAAVASRLKELLNAGAVKFVCNTELLHFMQDEEAFKCVYSAFTPDHMVYYKHKAMFLREGEDAAEAIRKFEQRYGFAPKIIGAQGLGVFACDDSEKSADIDALLFIDAVKIAVYGKSFGGAVFMPDWLIDFIANWEVEAYRKKQSN